MSWPEPGDIAKLKHPATTWGAYYHPETVTEPCACCGARQVADGCEGECAQCYETAGDINKYWAGQLDYLGAELRSRVSIEEHAAGDHRLAYFGNKAAILLRDLVEKWDSLQPELDRVRALLSELDEDVVSSPAPTENTQSGAVSE